MEEPIEHGHRGRALGQEAAPGLEGPMGGHAQAAVLVGGGHEAEEQVAPDIVERGEAEVVDDDEVRRSSRSMTRPTELSASPP